MSDTVERAAGEVVLELPAMAEFVSTARMVVASLARHNGFGDEQVEDLKIAVSEAITNSIRGHLDAGTSDPVRIAVAMEGDALTIEVWDRGTGFESVDEADLGETPAAGRLEGGLGLVLIRSLVTETTIETRPDGGSALRMTVKREAPQA